MSTRAGTDPRILHMLLLAALAAGIGCQPALDDRPWLITKLQIVGWKAEPPEVAPGGDLSLQAVALDPAGPPDTTATSWTLCRAPKPLDEDRLVAASCLPSASTSAVADADAIGDPVSLTVPVDACGLFGPDAPQPAPGAPPTRPRDPDASGGYYQPVGIALGSAVAVGLERITCDLPDASLAAARAFQAAYRPNQNPTIAGLSFTANGAPIDPAAVPPGARITIQATWLAGTAETFPVFDPESGAVIETQETLFASWYVTGGALDQPADEITDGTMLSTTTDWTAPSTPATLELVLILRDSRGGSDVTRAALIVAGMS